MKKLIYTVAVLAQLLASLFEVRFFCLSLAHVKKKLYLRHAPSLNEFDVTPKV